MRALLVNDTRNEKHIGCMASVEGLIKLCKDAGIEIIRTCTRADSLVKKLVEDVDLIVVNGEGTFHRSPLFFERVLDFIEENDLYAVILNTVWEKMFFNRDLDRIKLIAFRESMSLECFEESCPDYKGRIVLSADCAFVQEDGDLEIGYGDSVMGLLGSSLARNKNFFPMSFVGSIPDFWAYIQWLKSLDVYITGRFHGVVLSTIAGTPFLAFPSNSHKIEGLLKDMGCEELLIKSFRGMHRKIEIAKQSREKIIKYREVAKRRLNELKVILREVLNEIPDKNREGDSN